MTTRPIQPLDLSFLLNESRDTPQHVGGVMVFQNPAPGGWTIADLVQHYRVAKPAAPFDVVPQLRRLGAPAWVRVSSHDMRYHVQHVALPSPGTDEQLDELVQQWHGEQLDLHRPLFQVTIVEGLQGGRFAMYAKIHHSIVDGMSAVYRILGSVDKDAKAGLRAPFFAVEDKRGQRRMPAGVQAQLKRSLAGLKEQAASARELTNEFMHRMRALTAGARVEGSAPFGAGAKVMNAPLRYGRSFSHVSLPMEPLRAVAKAHGGTLNDAFLTVVDAAVVRYLAQRGQPSDEPLHALVPVSLHEEGAGTGGGGNAITGVICALGEPGADPHQRFDQVTAQMKAAKVRMRGLSKAAATNYFTGLFILAQGLGAVGVRRPVANYVVSNVPATAEPVYLGGALVLGMYPVNLLAVSMGLSVTLVSRAGQFDIGLIANRSAVPDVQRIAGLMQEVFAELTQPAKPKAGKAATKTRPEKQAPAKTAVTKKVAVKRTVAARASARKATAKAGEAQS